MILNLRYGNEAMAMILYCMELESPENNNWKHFKSSEAGTGVGGIIQRWTSSILLSVSRDILIGWRVSRSSSSHDRRRNDRPHLRTRLVGIYWKNKATKIRVYAHSYKEVKLQRQGLENPGVGGGGEELPYKNDSDACRTF